MSRGLGKLQRQILWALEEAKQENLSYRGSCREDNYGNFKNWKWDKQGWVFCSGYKVRIPDDIYDLRATLKFLALKHGHTYCRGAYVEGKYQAAFSRAVKSLIKRGLLEEVSLLPLAEYDGDLDIYFGGERIMQLSDGVYLVTLGRQTRFVRVMYTCRKCPENNGAPYSARVNNPSMVAQQS